MALAGSDEGASAVNKMVRDNTHRQKRERLWPELTSPGIARAGVAKALVGRALYKRPERKWPKRSSSPATEGAVDLKWRATPLSCLIACHASLYKYTNLTKISGLSRVFSNVAYSAEACGPTCSRYVYWGYFPPSRFPNSS